MKYDFTTIMDRHGKDALAVDGLGLNPGSAPDAPQEGFDAIPMWVADMNFPTVPTITDAIIKRAQHPAFGYFSPTEEYYHAIMEWQQKQNHVTGLTQENIGYENGVLGGVLSALSVIAHPGDKILVHSPTYIGFTKALSSAGYAIVHSPLLFENGTWHMDYADMKKKITENHIHATIFCSPHNPCGRVWKKDEIEKAMQIFEENEVNIISDEIWSDLLINGNQHIPTQSVNEYAHDHTVAFYAPSKTFNLAGLVGSYHIIYNKALNDRVVGNGKKTHYNSMNVLSMHALIGAYQPEGHEWLEELKEVLSKNVNYAYDYIQEHFQGVSLARAEGTYMLFLDCTDWCKTHHKTIEELEKAAWNVGVTWQDGKMFHGPYSVRINLAVPYSRVVEAFDRLDKYVFNAADK